MRRLTTYLIACAVTAWMAYLSWPMTADDPPVRKVSAESRSQPMPVNFLEAYEPKGCEPSV